MITNNSQAMNVKRVIVFLQLLETIYGVIDLTCDTANPSTQTNVTCVCTRKNGSSIKWYFDGISVADCFLTKGCFPKPDSYTFSINVSEFAYEMTKSGYDYNDCTPIQCTDAGDTSIEKTVVPAPVNFDPSNSTTITEPISNHTDGTVSITTGCISGYIDVKCEWYIVYDEKEEIYKHGQSAFDTYDNSTCSNCINDVLAKKTCGFIHEEASGNETKIVYFKVVLTHTPSNFKWKVKSANVYTVKGNVNQVASTKKGFWKKLEEWLKEFYYIVIVSILVLLSIILAIYLCLKQPGKVTIDFTLSSNSDETRSITVKWKSSCLDFRNLVYDLTYFKVVVKDKNIPKWDELLYRRYDFKNFEKSGNATGFNDLKKTEIEITDLSTGTYYKVKLVAKSSRGESDLCEKVFQTKLAAPKIISRNQAISSDTILVKWKHDDGNENANDILYSITYKQVGSKIKENVRHELKVKECSLEKLSEGTEYIIKVYAYRNFNFSDPDEKMMKTLIRDSKKPAVDPITSSTSRTEDETSDLGKKTKKKKRTKNDKRDPITSSTSRTEDETSDLAGKKTKKKKRPKNDKKRKPQTNGTKQTSGNPDMMSSSEQTSGNVNGNTEDEDKNVKCDKGQEDITTGILQDNLIKTENSEETDAREDGIENVEESEEFAEKTDNKNLTPVEASDQHQNRADISN